MAICPNVGPSQCPSLEASAHLRSSCPCSLSCSRCWLCFQRECCPVRSGGPVSYASPASESAKFIRCECLHFLSCYTCGVCAQYMWCKSRGPCANRACIAAGEKTSLLSPATDPVTEGSRGLPCDEALTPANRRLNQSSGSETLEDETTESTTLRRCQGKAGERLDEPRAGLGPVTHRAKTKHTAS